MSTLDRYLLKLFAGYLAIIIMVLAGLYGLIEFLEKVDSFIEHGATWMRYIDYPLYKLPQILSQMLPMAVLLGVFATIGLLSRTHQLTALKSCGISMGKVSQPLFAAGIFLSALMFAGGWLVPWSVHEARVVFDTGVKGDSLPEHRTDNLYFRDGRSIISVERSVPKHNEIHGLTLFDFDDKFKLVRRLEARRANWQEGSHWLANDAVIRTFNQAGDLTGFTRHASLDIDLGHRPEELVELWYQPDEMTSSELWRLADRLEGQGHDARRYRAEWQLRLAQSFTPLIMVLLGIPFALQRGRKASLGVGVALSLGIFAIYYLCQAVGMALGSVDLLPLALGAWAANILLFLIGSWLFLTLDN